MYYCHSHNGFATTKECSLHFLPYSTSRLCEPISEDLSHTHTCTAVFYLVALVNCVHVVLDDNKILTEKAVGEFPTFPAPQDYITLLMPPLIHKWYTLKDDNKDLFPLLEVSMFR